MDKMTSLGIEIETPDYFIMFANSFIKLDELKQKYSNYEFYTVKQVHGNNIVEGSPIREEADGHFTDKKNKALVIATADCLPVVIVCSDGKVAYSLHAGWKGVAYKIVPKGILSLTLNNKYACNEIQVFIGPHIMQDSFEVDLAVWEKLKDSISHVKNFEPFYKIKIINNTEKYYVNLELIVREQLSQCGIVNSQIHSYSIDTLTNLYWNSYRRDKEQSGRNMTFVVLKEQKYNKILSAFLRTLLVPLIIGKTLVLYFGVMYSGHEGEGYGYGLILALIYTVSMLIRFIWKYRHINDP